jgi:hypothetical protein
MTDSHLHSPSPASHDAVAGDSGHDADGHAAVPAEGEPETPFWLPALGFLIFVAGGIFWMVTPPAQAATPPAYTAPTAQPQVPATAAATAVPQPPPTLIPRPAPPPAASQVPPQASAAASASGKALMAAPKHAKKPHP